MCILYGNILAVRQHNLPYGGLFISFIYKDNTIPEFNTTILCIFFE